MNRRRQQGFTLVELFVVVVVLGVLSVSIAPYFDVAQVLRSEAYTLDQDRINRGIAAAMMESVSATDDLDLPAPFNDAGNNIFSAPLDPSDAANLELVQYIQDRAIDVTEIDDDGTNLERVRVYQRVNDQTIDVPVTGASGPRVTLTYDVGAIYQTRCERIDNACNGAPLPGDSPALDAANIGSWDTTGTDSNPVMISTISLHRERLRITAFRLNRVRDQIRAYANAQLLAAPPGSTTNYLPASGTPNGARTQGCWEDWQDLESTSVLSTVGLGSAEFGVTAWGGPIEYCSDYDPANDGPDVQPHVGALRLNRSVSLGQAPSATVGDNVFLTF